MSKLLKMNGIQFTRTKLGGATTMDKTATLLDAIHNFEKNNIIASPDLDIKNKKEYSKIIDNLKEQRIKIVYVGNNSRKEIEGLFSNEDKKYVVGESIKNKNKKMNKANLFWREVKSKKELNQKTIDNFQNYFKKLK